MLLQVNYDVIILDQACPLSQSPAIFTTHGQQEIDMYIMYTEWEKSIYFMRYMYTTNAFKKSFLSFYIYPATKLYWDALLRNEAAIKPTRILLQRHHSHRKVVYGIETAAKGHGLSHFREHIWWFIKS